MIRRTHLFHLEESDELSPGPIEAQHHDPVDEKSLVPEELALPVRVPLHHDERRQVVVSQHLEEVEHPLAHVVGVFHQGIQGAERIEREHLELVAVDLSIVADHPFDEGQVVRLILRTDNGIDLPQIREVANLHVHG